MDAAEAHVGAHIEAVEARMLETIETAETRLLTEFHTWASPLEARQRTHSAAMRAIDLELDALRERVDKLEGRKPS
jgi:hypothetical protein